MTATLTASRTGIGTAAPAAARTALWGPGIAAAVAAAAATTTVAAVSRAAGITFGPDGDQIPLAGFAQVTFVLSLVGVVLAAVLRRRAARPRRTFVRTTVVLAALSLAAPFLLPIGAASIAVLMADHVVAAAIVIPAVAARLR